MSDLEDMTVPELYEYQDALDYRAKQLKADVVELNAELERRYQPLVAEGQKRTGKAHGAVTTTLANGYRLRHETSMRVSWDDDKLMTWASALPWETVQHYCRVKFEVKESHYKTLDPSSDLRKTFADARTEKVGKTSYEILAPSEK
jgi:hypothetical protein